MLNDIKTMAVHSGSFHADDVFCVAMMQSIVDDLEIIRTRDEDILKKCDIVADVGGGKYDHHDLNKRLRPDGIPYCAFGLLWQDYGNDYIRKNFSFLCEDKVQDIVDKIAVNFITELDANDNGVDIIKCDYPIMTLSKIIDTFAPHGSYDIDKYFFKAVDFATHLLNVVVSKEVRYYDDLEYIQDLLRSQDTSCGYLVLDKRISWKEPLLLCDTNKAIKFVVYEDLSQKWMVQNVPIVLGEFHARAYLPKSWAGLSQQELDVVTGIDGCIFCHPARFLCGNSTKEGAIKLAKLALAQC
ncbi:MAG: hypothetical protein BEN18_10505 [Epulopiscium sp. Nuni2H_MBin001]|nr:MAG: hypothetical protein BEN18_10505 [Epulopiscium sp. Nuni2H_MBin001]